MNLKKKKIAKSWYNDERMQLTLKLNVMKAWGINEID